jgi:hypothetical protein
MKKYIFLFGVILITFILSSTTTKNKNAGEKIMINHISSANQQKIEVSVNKLQAHLAHGDSIVK